MQLWPDKRACEESPSRGTPAARDLNVPTCDVARPVRTALFRIPSTLRARIDRGEPLSSLARATVCGPDGHEAHAAVFFFERPDVPRDGEHSPCFAVRFTPTCVGSYAVVLEVSNGGWVEESRVALEFVDVPEMAAVSRLRFGINMCWHKVEGGESLLERYDRALTRFSTNGGGLVRIILTSWGLGIAPEVYDSAPEFAIRPGRARQLDALLDQCSRLDIAVVLCLFTFDDFRRGPGWDWEQNALSEARGGPCASPIEFFTCETALSFTERFIEAALARWAPYRCIAAWELFNEVDQVAGYERRAVRAWHRRMFGVIRAADKSGRPLMSSHASPLEIAEQTRYGATVLSLHNYGWPSSSPARNSVYWARGLRIGSTQSAVVAEFSLRSDAPPTTEDPSGELTRATLWASLFAGWATPAWPWYWDTHIEALDLWHVWVGLRRFCDAVDWLGEEWEEAEVSVHLGETHMAPRRLSRQIAVRVNYLAARVSRLLTRGEFKRTAHALYHCVRFMSSQTLGPSILALGRYRRAGGTLRCVVWVARAADGRSRPIERADVVVALPLDVAPRAAHVRLWDTRTGEILSTLLGRCRPEGVCFSIGAEGDVAADVEVLLD